MAKFTKTQSHRPDFILLFTVFVLVLFGLLMVYNASPVTSLRDFGDPLYLIKQQAIWVSAGLALSIIAFLTPYSLWKSLALPIIIFSLLLLLAVFIPGLGVKIYGAQRWLCFSFACGQPAEFAKLAYIVFLATVFSKKHSFPLFLIATGLLIGIVLLQRDMGTSIVLAAVGLAIYFVSGSPIWHILGLVPFLAGAGAVLILTSGYRKARFLAFLNPSVDPQGISYHINQVLIAIGSGGILGVGLGQSRQKYGFIPEVTTDSIFAVIGNEIGFLGSLVFLSFFLLLIFRGFKIASAAPDKFAYLVAVGITTWIGIQMIINIAGLTASLPLAGVPLPFISYGGSSLVSVMVGVAILLNISRFTQTQKIKS